MTTKIPAELSSTPGIADSSDATAITITSSEQVGIGTTSPVATLQVKTQADGNLAFQNSTSVTGGVKLNCFNDAANASSPFEIDGSSLQFNIASSIKARIDSDGLKFGSDTAAANAFDDYEEGTFTPAFSATGLSVTHDLQNGLYTKIGDTVNFWILLGTDAKSGSSSSYGLTITGLPYACKNTASSFVSGAVGLAYTWTSNEQSMKWFIGANTSIIALYAGDSNAGGTITPADMGTTSNDNRLYISGSYKTD